MNRKSIIPVAALMIILFSMTPIVSHAADDTQITSFGKGPTRIYLFTDYFCHPCRSVEPFLEAELPGLLEQEVGVSFIDKPIYEYTPLYARYFLYALKNAGGFENALRIRKFLFDLAETQKPTTDEALYQAFKTANIPVSLIDVRPVFQEWIAVMNKYEVRSTPTCVVVLPTGEIRKYGGADIKEGIEKLKNEMLAASVK